MQHATSAHHSLQGRWVASERFTASVPWLLPIWRAEPVHSFLLPGLALPCLLAIHCRRCVVVMRFYISRLKVSEEADVFRRQKHSRLKDEVTAAYVAWLRGAAPDMNRGPLVAFPAESSLRHRASKSTASLHVFTALRTGRRGDRGRRKRP